MTSGRLAPLRIDFAQRPARWWLGHASSRRERAAAGLLLALALLAGGVATLRLHDAFASAQRHRLALAQRLAATAPPPLAPPPKPSPSVAAADAIDLRQLNQARRLLNTPWSDLLDAFERNASPGVGLTALAPDGATGRLGVQAEARDVDTLLAYAQTLAADPALGSLVLHQQATNELDPNRPARLSFDLALRPARGAP